MRNRRQILPGHLRKINHNGSVFEPRGPISSGWSQSPCASTGRMEPRLRPRRHPSAAPPAASTLRSISTLDALMALQGVDDPLERKKRAVAKGRNALDVLDSLKVGLIDGSVDGSTLSRLKVAAEGLTEESGDSGLDTVLDEINLRVAVELAKAGL